MIFKDFRWIMHKDNQFYEPLLLGSPSVGLGLRIAFPVLYIIISVIVYRISSRYGGGYGKTANIFLFIGFFIGFFLIILEDFIDFGMPSFMLDSRTKKIIIYYDGNVTHGGASHTTADRHPTDSDVDGVFIVEKDNIGLWKTSTQRKELSYALRAETLKKLIQSKKIKGSSFGEWAKLHHKPNTWSHHVSNITETDISLSGLYWKAAVNHCIFLLTHTLTLAYIVGHWDINVFKSTFLWAASACCLGISTLLWWDVQTYVDRKYVLYFIKKMQLIASGLALIAVLGFIGRTAFKK